MPRPPPVSQDSCLFESLLELFRSLCRMCKPAHSVKSCMIFVSPVHSLREGPAAQSGKGG